MMNDLSLALKIMALVEGQKNVDALKDSLKGIGNEVTKPILDPTPPLRDGADKTKNAIRDLGAELATLASFTTFGSLFVKSSVDAMRQAESAFRGLEAISRHAGISIQESFAEAGKIASDGLVSVADASKALQNLLARGFSLEQAVETINRLKDAAAFNRQASLSMSEAVVTATEGLKNENSVLVDNAGVTKNVAKMWEDYANQIGVSVQDLTQAQKVQAEYNGILKETEAQVGNAKKASEGFEGGLARLSQNTKELQAAFGGDLQPALNGIGDALNFVVDVAKHAAVGLNVLGADAGALVTSVEDINDAFNTLNFEGLGEKIARNFDLAQEMAVEAVDRYENGLTPAIQQTVGSLDRLGASGKQAGADLRDGQDQAKEATDAFSAALDETGKKSESAKTKLSDLIQQFDLLKPDNADRLALAMGRLGGSSEGAAKTVRDDLVKAVAELGGPELQGYVERLRRRLQEAGPAASQLATALDVGVRESFKRLGIDADQALTGVSAKVQDGISALNFLGANLKGAGVSAQRAGTIIREGLSNLLNQAKTSAEIQAVIAEIDKLKASGQLTGQALIDAYAAAFEAQKKIGVSAAEVQAAQDKARLSADALTQAIQSGKISQAELTGEAKRSELAERLLAQAASDSAAAIRLQGAAAKEVTSEISKAASEITRREYAQAASFRQIQRQADQTAESQKKVADATNRAAKEFHDGDQAMSPWIPLYQDLARFSQDYVRQMHEIGASRAGTQDFTSDLAWGYEKLKDLTSQEDQVKELTAALHSAASGGGDLAGALAHAGFGLQQVGSTLESVKTHFYQLGDSEALAPLADAIDAVREKLRGQQQEAEAGRKAASEALVASAKESAETYTQSMADANTKVAGSTKSAMAELADSVEKVLEKAAADAAGVVEDYRQKVAAIRADASETGAGIDEAIRGIRREGLTEEEKRIEAIAELRKKMSEAQIAIQQGEIDHARKLRDEVIDLAKTISKEVKDAQGNVLITQEDAAKEAVKYLEKSRGLNVDLAKAAEAAATAERDRKLAAIEAVKRAELAAVREANAEKLKAIQTAFEAELAAATKLHKERMSQIYAENDARSGRSVPQPGKPFKPGGIGARAKGGPVDRDKLYLVGEEGPELFTPDRSGLIIPQRRAAAAPVQTIAPTQTIRLELVLPGGKIIPATVDARFADNLLDLQRARRSAV